MKNRIFIIDGSSYLYRAYHAMPPLTTSSGKPTGAVKGVTNMLMNLKKESEGSPIVVVFDAKGKNFRHDIFEEYMVTGIIPIWVTYYAKDIIKLDKAKILDSYNKKYHVYDHEFGKVISNEKQRKTRGIFYTILIGLVFVGSHYIAINRVDEPAGFYPPYIEKKIIYPELYQKKSDSKK